MPRVAILYQALDPPMIDGARKPKKPGGYQDLGADIAFNLRSNHDIEIITPLVDPHAAEQTGWAFPDTEDGILTALHKGATHLWANTIFFASHPLQTSSRMDTFLDSVRVVGQGPLMVDRYDDKNYVNNLLRSAGGFFMPRLWPFSDSTTLSALAGIAYPVVAKPARGRGSYGVKVCRDAQELFAHARALQHEAGLVMVKEFLSGEAATMTVMPPIGTNEGYWSLSVVLRTNHHDGIAPYNGVVSATANSRVLSDDENDPICAQAKRQCERAAALLGVCAPVRIDIRRYEDSTSSKFAIFDVNMKPVCGVVICLPSALARRYNLSIILQNMTGPGRPGRDDQASLTLIAANAVGWDLFRAAEADSEYGEYLESSERSTAQVNHSWLLSSLG